MSRWKILRLLSLVCVLVLPAACLPSEALSWQRHPQARIIRATFCCSVLMSPNEQKVYLAEAQIWGDGRIIWVERGPTERVLVGFLSDEEMVMLIEQIAEAGYFDWQAHYRSETPPTDTPSRCIEVHLVGRSKQVCELDSGAPPAFEEIYTNLTSGAGSQGNDYVPEIGYLSAIRLNEIRLRAAGFGLPEPDLEWPEEMGFPPAEAVQGIWISGPPLAKIWRAVFISPYHFPAVRDESGTYRLLVQVPGVSWVEPPRRR